MCSSDLKKIAECIRLQEQIGLDVLVHGEFERNDMVEYFGENLQGFLFTQKEVYHCQCSMSSLLNICKLYKILQNLTELFRHQNPETNVLFSVL